MVLYENKWILLLVCITFLGLLWILWAIRKDSRTQISDIDLQSKKTLMVLNEVKTETIRKSILNLDEEGAFKDSFQIEKSVEHSPASSINAPSSENSQQERSTGRNASGNGRRPSSASKAVLRRLETSTITIAFKSEMFKAFRHAFKYDHIVFSVCRMPSKYHSRLDRWLIYIAHWTGIISLSALLVSDSPSFGEILLGINAALLSRILCAFLAFLLKSTPNELDECGVNIQHSAEVAAFKTLKTQRLSMQLMGYFLVILYYAFNVYFWIYYALSMSVYQADFWFYMTILGISLDLTLIEIVRVFFQVCLIFYSDPQHIGQLARAILYVVISRNIVDLFN